MVSLTFLNPLDPGGEHTSYFENFLIPEFLRILEEEVGKLLSISNRKKKHIERSVRNRDSSEKPQILAQMPRVISAYRRCPNCSTKEREEKDEYNS